MKPHYDTVIIGGGIIGLFTAWELARAGQSVCVLDKGEMGREASWAAGGILSPLRPWKYPEAVNELASASQAKYAGICEELRESSGIDPQWRKSGLLILDCSELEEAQAWAESYQQALEVLPPDHRSGHTEIPACLLPEVAQVRNPRLLKALVKTVDALGVDLMPHTPATGLGVESGRARSVQTLSDDIAAGAIVIAAGAWSSQVTNAVDLTITPVKGQMLVYAPLESGLEHILMLGDHYLIPRADGRIVVGSTVEDCGFDKSTDAASLAALQTTALALCPALGSARLESQWAGLRPASTDEAPIIGPASGIEGLYLNTGHYRSGIVMAPASARLLAGQILASQK